MITAVSVCHGNSITTATTTTTTPIICYCVAYEIVVATLAAAVECFIYIYIYIYIYIFLCVCYKKLWGKHLVFNLDLGTRDIFKVIMIMMIAVVHSRT